MWEKELFHDYLGISGVGGLGNAVAQVNPTVCSCTLCSYSELTRQCKAPEQGDAAAHCKSPNIFLTLFYISNNMGNAVPQESGQNNIKHYFSYPMTFYICLAQMESSAVGRGLLGIRHGKQNGSRIIKNRAVKS